MRKYLVAASAAALLAAAAIGGVALAQGSPQAPAPAEHRHGGKFAQYDTNADGVITRQEFDAARHASFARLDANSDGALSRDEMRAEHRGGPGGGHRMGGHGMRAMMLDHADANHDGAISREEFLAGPIARFDRLDTNHDGVISADERTQERTHAQGERHARFSPDANSDGVVSQAEYAAAGDAMFQRLDADHDGRVTQAELEAGRPHWGDRR